MIKSSSHNTSYSNFGKRIALASFLSSYQLATQNYINFIWNNQIIVNDNIVFDIKNNILNIPSYIDYNLIKFDTELSARALSSAATQACGIVKSTVKKKSKLFWFRNKVIAEGKSTFYVDKKLEKLKFSCPILKDLKAELSSKCLDFEETNGKFFGFLRLKSIGESFSHIKIPINIYKYTESLREKGTLMNSFLISKDKISVRWEIPDPPKKTIGNTVGADTGFKTILTLSDNQRTPTYNEHGYSLEKICKNLSNKKKGSKAFKRGQDHRTNFINWSINQLSFDGIKEIKLEKVSNIFFQKNMSIVMKRWTNSVIEKKVMSVAESLGVQVTLQSCAYRSQRCSGCGLVKKSNRRGKVYSCQSCGLTIDSDYNASLNNEKELLELSEELKYSGRNKKEGFYWDPPDIFPDVPSLQSNE